MTVPAKIVGIEVKSNNVLIDRAIFSPNAPM
jgi:hypothetical protein